MILTEIKVLYRKKFTNKWVYHKHKLFLLSKEEAFKYSVQSKINIDLLSFLLQEKINRKIELPVHLNRICSKTKDPLIRLHSPQGLN